MLCERIMRCYGYMNLGCKGQIKQNYVFPVEIKTKNDYRPRQVVNCKIWGFHGGDYEEWCLLGCYAVWLL
jgi:hypothetical protein